MAADIHLQGPRKGRLWGVVTRACDLPDDGQLWASEGVGEEDQPQLGLRHFKGERSRACCVSAALIACVVPLWGNYLRLWEVF